jgi:protein-S-isoprenylcysteine O-methyltransferase Ste14
MLPLLQLFLLILTTVLYHISVTSPNLKSTDDYAPDEGVGSTYMSAYGPILGKLSIWILTLYQVLYLSLQAFLPSLISTLYPQIPAFINPLPFTPISVLGYIFMIVGGLGRIWCYKTLGRFFTYEITIRNSHKLIKTGPYAYVRHPSYTFFFILTFGMFLVHHRFANFFPNNTWIQIMFSPGSILITCIMLLLVTIRRVIREEEELKKTFGKEWIEYASKTRRFIPGII